MEVIWSEMRASTPPDDRLDICKELIVTYEVPNRMDINPQFESDFLNDVAFSFKKRRKSLKHRCAQIAFGKVYEIENNQETERLELKLQARSSSKGERLRLHAWPDRWIWVDARKGAKKGWEWEWTFDGRLLGAFTGRDLIAAVEESLAFSFYSDTAPQSYDVSNIWQPLLAKGPTRIV